MTTTTTSAPLFAGFAGQLRTAWRRTTTLAPTYPEDRDRQRLLDDLRALSDARADAATACACRRSGR